MKVIPDSIMKKYAILSAQMLQYFGKDSLHYMKIFSDGSGAIIFEGYNSVENVKNYSIWAKKHNAHYYFEQSVEGTRIKTLHQFTPILTEEEQATQIPEEDLEASNENKPTEVKQP